MGKKLSAMVISRTHFYFAKNALKGQKERKRKDAGNGPFYKEKVSRNFCILKVWQKC